MKKESITINQKEPHYEIESITPVSAHVLQIVFAGDVPPAYGDVQVYTAGGSQCSERERERERREREKQLEFDL